MCAQGKKKAPNKCLDVTCKACERLVTKVSLEHTCKGGPEAGSIGAMGAFDKGGEGLAFHSAIRWGKVVAVVCA